jgi:hypothetical protein
MAQQTGGGFGNYVAGDPKTSGLGALGNQSKIKREDVQFESKFLGMMI